jgi:IPT/TIG domain
MGGWGSTGRIRGALLCAVMPTAVAAALAGPAAALDLAAAPTASPLGSGQPAVLALSPDEGPTVGGTKVTIAGEHLAGVTTVSFGGAPVTLKKPSKSQTTIKVVAPAGSAGTVDVTVTGPEGTSEVVPGDEYTYVASPPAITKLSPDFGPGAGGKPIVIHGVDFGEASEVDFGGESIPFTLKNSRTIKATVPPAHTISSVPVTVTTPEGTSTVTPASEYTYSAEFPAVEELDPPAVLAAGGATVRIVGAGFLGATKVAIDHKPASFEVLNDAEIDAIAPPDTVSKVPVQVTTPEGTSPEKCASQFCKPVPHFEYFGPMVTLVEPDSGPAAGGTAITVTGSGFGTGKEETAILIGRSFATEVHCASSSVCTAVTAAAKKAGTQPLTVRIKSNKPERTSEEEASFSYE